MQLISTGTAAIIGAFWRRSGRATVPDLCQPIETELRAWHTVTQDGRRHSSTLISAQKVRRRSIGAATGA